MGIARWIIVGAALASIARWVMPGPDPAGAAGSIVLLAYRSYALRWQA